MWPAPAEKPECLPYTLPPGPYSEQKPELSYAAIIGQAILASPGHALALQDIYEYNAAVYEQDIETKALTFLEIEQCRAVPQFYPWESLPDPPQ